MKTIGTFHISLFCRKCICLMEIIRFISKSNAWICTKKFLIVRGRKEKRESYLLQSWQNWGRKLFPHIRRLNRQQFFSLEREMSRVMREVYSVMTGMEKVTVEWLLIIYHKTRAGEYPIKSSDNKSMTNRRKFCFTECIIRVKFTITKLWGGHAETETRKMENGSLQAFKHNGPVALQIKMASELQCYYFVGAWHHFRSRHAGK